MIDHRSIDGGGRAPVQTPNDKRKSDTYPYLPEDEVLLADDSSVLQSSVSFV